MVCACVRPRVRAFVRACVRACVCVCVRACVREVIAAHLVGEEQGNVGREHRHLPYLRRECEVRELRRDGDWMHRMARRDRAAAQQDTCAGAAFFRQSESTCLRECDCLEQASWEVVMMMEAAEYTAGVSNKAYHQRLGDGGAESLCGAESAVEPAQST